MESPSNRKTATTPDTAEKTDEIFEARPVTTPSESGRLSDHEIDGVTGGAACGAGACSPDLKKRTLSHKIS